MAARARCGPRGFRPIADPCLSRYLPISPGDLRGSPEMGAGGPRQAWVWSKGGSAIRTFQGAPQFRSSLAKPPQMHRERMGLPATELWRLRRALGCEFCGVGPRS